jgi:hypothetical protein
MEKKAHQYKLTLAHLKNIKGEEMNMPPLEIIFENHDDIFSIIERTKEKDFFGNIDQSTEFAIGLKLFSEVMLRNRNNPLFQELGPAFALFMKRIKK